ncbi:MAG: hypothetical protein GY829_13540 [Gammaproteobacteria bacterium]|nr:hypothetical protein [Gammaproteobacteria bacterium]
MIDEDYVEALEKQAECLAHHLQVLTFDDTKSNVVNAEKAINSYFEFKRDNSND